MGRAAEVTDVTAARRPLEMRVLQLLAVGLSLSLLSTLSGCAQSDPELAHSKTTTGPRSETPESPPGEHAPEQKQQKSKALKGGGFASAVPGSDAPNRKDDTGPVIPLSATTPDIKEIERLVRKVEKIAAQQGALDPAPSATSVADAVGTFSYRYFADGSLDPDPAWVAANITTETVPILGSVTGHRVMLPQLRAALAEIEGRGLGDELNPEEYAGCYVPRFIASDPSNGLSLHSWGIAVDLNVPGNLRGTVGEMDRTVVTIFKKWGFAWGGDWNYTDPMHFELAQLVKT